MTTTATMLLRSSSTPILNSYIPHSNSKDSPHEPEILHRIPRTRSVTLSASSSSLSPIDASPNRMTRALSETDLSARHKRKPLSRRIFEEDEESVASAVGFRSRTASFGSALFSFSELDEGEDGVGLMDDAAARVLVEGGGGGGAGGWDNSDGGGSGYWDSNPGNDSTDLYYRTMIEANPGNPLFLSNYARYLKEVRGDYVKAEEYCGRAILANPNDGNVLSMYAELLWESHKDASRAETYFDQAVKAAPDDCYVLASYAHFLWDADEEDDVVQEDSSEKSPSFLHGSAPLPPPPLAAAS
ncbi:uncharacterized protein LOC113846831 [Abrus precatorius]|uniref:Uncharacterized protein LOC113846831 n=1 Tax=Abrus precatorius TaxID=3816 RepID=A0A8B8JIM7_ABRPR|nr:uncharacterized protein LOC113846831 [Abrus precatorius]